MRNSAEHSTSSHYTAGGARTEAFRLALAIEADFVAGAGNAATDEARQDAARAHLAQLRQKLRRERALGKSGHAGYDLSRHLALAQMVKAAAPPSQVLGALPAANCRAELGGAAPSAEQQNAPAAKAAEAIVVCGADLAGRAPVTHAGGHRVGAIPGPRRR